METVRRRRMRSVESAVAHPPLIVVPVGNATKQGIEAPAIPRKVSYVDRGFTRIWGLQEDIYELATTYVRRGFTSFQMDTVDDRGCRSVYVNFAKGSRKQRDKIDYIYEQYAVLRALKNRKLIR